MNTDLKMVLSPESRLSDICALLDNYGVEIIKDGLTYQRGPLYCVAPYEPSTSEIDFTDFTLPAIDFRIEVRMVQAGEDFLERHGRSRSIRWPFFVEHPLRIMFLLRNQWWDYRFTPGKKYEERKMKYPAA